MSIADNIEKDFARLLRESRSVARHKLVAQAADKEDAIRAKRPRKEKNKKSVIEEAHPDEVFVAESDGLGGRAGNPEQVQQQIIDALNRRPSAFPYQGLVANAMADFEKTAEVLESHNLFSEAAAIRKVAAEWLSVLERRGAPGLIKKKANTVLVPDEVLSASSSTITGGYAFNPRPGEYDTYVSSTAPGAPLPSAVSTNPPDIAPDTEDVRAAGGAASVEGKATAHAAGQAPTPPVPSNNPAHVVASVDAASDAAKDASFLAKARKAADKFSSKIKGPFAKALGYLGIAGDAALIGSYAIDKDWTSLIGTVGAGAAAAAIGAPVAGGAAAVAAVAGTGIAIYSMINETILGAWQEDLDTDIKDAINAVQSVLDANDTDAAQKAAAQGIMTELRSISKNIAVLRQEANKGKQAKMETIAAGIADNKNSVIAAYDHLDKLKDATIFDFGVRRVIATLEDIEDSENEFNEELERKLSPLLPEITEAIKQLSAAAAARKGIIGELNVNIDNSSGTSSATGSAGAPAVSTDDPNHVKEVQAALNDLRAPDVGFTPKLALTGKWDQQTENVLSAYVRIWLEVDPNLAEVLSVGSLKDSQGSVIRAINEDYRNKEQLIASIMRGSTNK